MFRRYTKEAREARGTRKPWRLLIGRSFISRKENGRGVVIWPRIVWLLNERDYSCCGICGVKYSLLLCTTIIGCITQWHGSTRSGVQNLNFHNSLNKFERYHPYEYAWIVGVNVFCTFRGDIVWTCYFSYGPILTEMKNKNHKIQNFKIWKTNRWSGISPKLGVNQFYGLARSLQMDDRRTTDARAMTVPLLCSNTKKS